MFISQKYASLFNMVPSAVENALVFECRDAPVQISMPTKANAPPISLEYSTDSTSYQEFILGTTSISLQPGQTARIRAVTSNDRMSSGGTSYSNTFVMTGSGSISLHGTIMALLNKDPSTFNSISHPNAFQNLFRSCSLITDISEGLLPATHLTSSCYQHLFYRCDGLETIHGNILPATELAPSCYKAMFFACESLERAPELFAETVPEGESCYDSMFQACISLNYLKTHQINPSELYHQAWLDAVDYPGTFVCRSSLTYTVGPDSVPEDWIVETFD